MKQLLRKLTTTILTYTEHALLDIICLHEMGMSSAEVSHVLPAPYLNDYGTRLCSQPHPGQRFGHGDIIA